MREVPGDLSRVWRGESGTEEELAAKVTTQRPADVRAAVEQLREADLMLPAAPLALTARGTATRERIEAETDRYFFAPWPDAVGAQADWLTERLAEVNAALA